MRLMYSHRVHPNRCVGHVCQQVYHVRNIVVVVFFFCRSYCSCFTSGVNQTDDKTRLRAYVLYSQTYEERVLTVVKDCIVMCWKEWPSTKFS